MALKSIERFLKQRMGLHSSTVGTSVVAQAVEQRMLACDIDNPHDYLRVVSHSNTELDALIDAVVIPETWFFRDQHPFSAFSNWVSRHCLVRSGPDPLRILSVPCSTGEEPYTLAMCLADVGLPVQAAQIDAVDISTRNIETAAAATYGNNSFRSTDLGFRDRYFVRDGQQFKLKEEIRTRVNFFRANILEAAFLQQQPYHVIFCRNLLIYFDRPTQNHAIEQLEQLLTRDGLLFLGHSETSLLLERNFSPLNYPRCFGFQREQNKPRPLQQSEARRPASNALKLRADTNRSSDTPRPFAEVVQEVSPPQNAAPATGEAAAGADNLLNKAFQLADQGHLDEAAQCCETLLRQQQHQADAHFLLGLVREAAGSTEDAAQMFRKTIYLDPDHYEALTHLSVICQQQGDAASAQRFQQRAARAQQRNQAEENSR